MRLFVSVEPSAEAVRSLGAAVDAVRPVLPDARWTGADRWHLTLAFLGEVADGRVRPLERALTGVAADAGPLRLQLKGAGTFPPRGHPRVLWVGLAGDTTALAELARAVAHAARSAGIRLERRPFRPHLTLARLRDRTDAAPALTALADYTGPAYDVTEFHLVRSYLGPRPRHEKLRNWSLGDTDR